MTDDDQLAATVIQEHPYPLLFASVTGSHSFGCATPLSDYDVHGCHLLPLREVLLLPFYVALGEDHAPETVERKHLTPTQGREVDMATHDLQKFVLLLLKGNGGLLEDLYSPLVLVTSSLHEELRELARGCITKQVGLYYKWMAHNQQRRLRANEVKKLLHMYRCLLMGIHLMRTGTLEMGLPRLANEYDILSLIRLISLKRQGIASLTAIEAAEHLGTIHLLTARLLLAREESRLPETVAEHTRKALEQVVVRVRLEGRV